MADASERADKWLFQARFFKSRSLAAALVSGGGLRVNGQHATKPAHDLRVGDVLTFPQGNRIRLIRITALAQRRGPASEARELYDDLDSTP